MSRDRSSPKHVLVHHLMMRGFYYTLGLEHLLSAAHLLGSLS